LLLPKRQCHDLPPTPRQLLDQIIQPFDLTHDFGRKGAYEAAIEYARQNSSRIALQRFPHAAASASDSPR